MRKIKSQGKLKICSKCGTLEYHRVGKKVCRECVKHII